MLLALTRHARRRIERLGRRTRDAQQRVRCFVVLKVAGGKTRRGAALDLDCAPSTAWVIVDRFRQWGEASLFDRRCENGTRKIDPDTEEALRAMLRQTPEEFGFARPTWTLELLARVAAEHLGLHLSVGHLWKVLQQMGIRWNCARPVVACPWRAERRRRRLAELRRLERNPGPRGVVVFADEVDIHLNPRIGRDWMLPGTRRLVMTPGKNQKRFIAGAFEPKSQRLVYAEGDRKASWLFLNLLRGLLEAYAWASRIYIILDNYVIHKSRIVERWLRDHGGKIHLCFLPPYCPEANRIERIWLNLHNNVTRNHRCHGLAELMSNVRRYLHARFRCYHSTIRESCEGV